MEINDNILFVNSIIDDAIKKNSSDIHIEPFEENVRIRFRINGSLVEYKTVDKSMHSKIITRIKIMSELDIAEKRLPQDGRITYTYENSKIDLRISIINTIHGQKCVIRILNPESFKIGMQNLGISENEQKMIEGFTKFENGMVLICGPTGSGKTTILKLISRLYDYDEGQILIDGKDIKEISTESLFDKVSIVFQDVVLFNQSVMENIRLGKQDASDEEVKIAAKLANCTDFIEKMDKGFDTVIGENGAELSGGERQRLSIARAFLKDAPILILDEIAASLDVDNEKKIQESLNNLVKDKTVVIISHRMKSIENADKIVVLENGRIESEGKHEELLQKSKVYKNLIEKTKMAEEFIY